jgi:hypothetical protein
MCEVKTLIVLSVIVLSWIVFLLVLCAVDIRKLIDCDYFHLSSSCNLANKLFRLQFQIAIHEMQNNKLESYKILRQLPPRSLLLITGGTGTLIIVSTCCIKIPKTF